jgi:hypothetical protein
MVHFIAISHPVAARMQAFGAMHQKALDTANGHS